MRLYCWLIFFAIAILSTWSFPAEGEEGNVLVLDNEQQEDFDVESRLLDEEDEDEDDDDDDEIVTDEDGVLAITGRHYGKGKPQKNKQKKQKCFCLKKKPNKKYGQKYHKRPGQNKKPQPSGNGNQRPSSGNNNQGPSSGNNNQRPSSPSGGQSQRPGGQGNQNQGGCKTVVCNFVSSVKNVLSGFTANQNRPYNNNDQRPPNGF